MVNITKSGTGWKVYVVIDRDANPLEIVQELKKLKLPLLAV
jgi:hypothetical protein